MTQPLTEETGKQIVELLTRIAAAFEPKVTYGPLEGRSLEAEAMGDFGWGFRRIYCSGQRGLPLTSIVGKSYAIMPKPPPSADVQFVSHMSDAELDAMLGGPKSHD